MEKKHQDFYQKIRTQISNYLAKNDYEFGEILMLAPDFFHLLVKLSLDDRVEPRKKAKLAIGILYFVTPIDILPEAILGPIGYLDDLAVAAYILNDFVNKSDVDIVHEHWAGEGDVLASIQNVLSMVDHFLGEGLWNRIKKKISDQ